MNLKHLYILIFSIITGLTVTLVTQVYATPVEDESLALLCAEWPPFEYTGKNGKPTGYSVEILQAILQELNIEDNIRILPWKRAYVMAQHDKNTLIFTMARTKDREKQFKWIGPIAPRKIYLWKLKERTDIKVNNLEDVKKYMVATIRGEAGEKQLFDMGFNIGQNITQLVTVKQTYPMLYSKRVDFIYSLEFSLFFGLKKAGLNPDKIEKSLLLSEGLEYYYAFNPDTSDLIVEKFQKALQKIKDNGTFDKIANKYRQEPQ